MINRHLRKIPYICALRRRVPLGGRTRCLSQDCIITRLSEDVEKHGKTSTSETSSSPAQKVSRTTCFIHARRYDAADMTDGRDD